MSNISEWSATAASNNSASPNGAPEGMAPSGVNDTIRENMAAAARVYQDQKGAIVTTGSSNTYALTTTNAHNSLADIGLTVFRANAANTGSSTLNVDSLGAKTLKLHGQNIPAGTLVADTLYAVVYNSTNDVYDLVGHNSGEVLLSHQTASPAANIDFTQFTSAYENYRIEIRHMKLTSDSQSLYLLTSTDGGSSYDQGSSYYSEQTGGVVNGVAVISSSTTSNQITTHLSALGNDTNEFCSIDIEIVSPASTDYTSMFIKGYGYNPSGQLMNWSGFATRLSAADVDAVRLIPSSSTIASGEFKLYGIR